MDTPGTGAVEIDRWTRAEWWMLTVSCLAVALVVAAMAALYSALPQIAVETGGDASPVDLDRRRLHAGAGVSCAACRSNR